MDDPTTAMHIVQTEQDLLGDLLAYMHWDAFILMSLDQAEEIFA